MDMNRRHVGLNRYGSGFQIFLSRLEIAARLVQYPPSHSDILFLLRSIFFLTIRELRVNWSLRCRRSVRATYL